MSSTWIQLHNYKNYLFYNIMYEMIMIFDLDINNVKIIKFYRLNYKIKYYSVRSMYKLAIFFMRYINRRVSLFNILIKSKQVSEL